MIKVYLDWNIISSIKQGNLQELKSILEFKEKFLVPYSTSHIGDIFASHSESEVQKERIQKDLEYITSITDNNCFFNDGKGNIQLGFMNPIELYEERIDSQDLFRDFSIDKLFAPFDIDDDDEVIAPLITLLKGLLKSIPLDNTFKEAFKNPEITKEMEKMFPDLKDNLTFEGWFKTFGNMYNRLNDTEDYKGLREAVQKIGVNSSHFSQGKNPYDVIGDAYQKLGTNPFETNSDLVSSKNTPDWFNELSNEYILLDMHGYKQDKVKVDNKNKQTFRNTTDDAFHSAFASRCDFYITSDKKNIDKSKAIYKKFGVETCVMTPDEFTEYYNDFLDIHSFDEHLSNLIDVIKKGKGYYKFGNEYDEKGEPFSFVGFSNHYFFNFFNKVRICTSSSNGTFYLLTKEHPSRIYYIAYKEIENVLKMFVNHFGVDDNGKERYKTGEMNDYEWEGRKWTLDTIEVTIKRVNGWFQLYIYPMEEESKNIITKITKFFRKMFKSNNKNATRFFKT
ncbi:hypothetical protein [Gelidibacter gilvus]|uniref:Uncharacterized protein n=1 Tax=Gelidibacter gilvus TaxID=59602 RepID=A0A4Q0XDB1_9FLAO|nr:hypothetical protein [Gelidibacter gilvus]RXJ45932.1 hypothetical protein ESZ48_14025 [Gelidibacter gilvus]